MGLDIVSAAREEAIATVVNYALHPAILAGQNFLYSADFPGVLAREMDERRGGVCIFTNGATGDVNHLDLGNPAQSRGFEETERVGRLLADEATRILRRATPVSNPLLKVTTRRVCLPLRAISEEDAAKAKALIEGKDLTSLSQVDGIPEELYAEQILRIYGSGAKSVCPETQAVSIGEVTMLTTPGELFSAIGRAIKALRSGTFVVTYANDYVGYIPTREAFAQGGYEVKTGIASKLAPEAGELLLRQAQEMLD